MSTSGSDRDRSADAVGASRDVPESRPRHRARAYLSVALVVAAILGATLYFFDVRQLRANESGLDLFVASYIRETVPRLRKPQYFQERAAFKTNSFDELLLESTIKHRIIREYR